jgi:hypothetical protein
VRRRLLDLLMALSLLTCGCAASTQFRLGDAQTHQPLNDVGVWLERSDASEPVTHTDANGLTPRIRVRSGDRFRFSKDEYDFPDALVAHGRVQVGKSFLSKNFWDWYQWPALLRPFTRQERERFDAEYSAPVSTGRPVVVVIRGAPKPVPEKAH